MLKLPRGSKVNAIVADYSATSARPLTWATIESSLITPEMMTRADEFERKW